MSAVSPHSCSWHWCGKRPWKQAVSSNSCDFPLGGKWVGKAEDRQRNTRRHRMCSDFYKMLWASLLQCQVWVRLEAKTQHGRHGSCPWWHHLDSSCPSASGHAGYKHRIISRKSTEPPSFSAGMLGMCWLHSGIAPGTAILAHLPPRPTDAEASFLHTSSYGRHVHLLVFQIVPSLRRTLSEMKHFYLSARGKKKPNFL